MQRRYLAGLPVWAGPTLAVLGAGFVGLAVAFTVVHPRGSSPAADAGFDTPTIGGGVGTATPRATATETAAPPLVIDGKPVIPLELVAAEPLTPGTVVYYTYGCSVCNDANLARVVIGEDGSAREEGLLRANHPGLPAGYPLAPMVTDGTSMFGVAWCHSDGGVCGKRHDESIPFANQSVVLSRDGGVTWTVAGEMPDGGAIATIAGGDVLVATGEGEGILLPSGAAARVSESDSPYYPVWPAGLDLVVAEDIENVTGSGIAFNVVPEGLAPEEWYAFIGPQIQLVRAVDDHRVIGWAARQEKTGEAEVFGPILIDLQTATMSTFTGLPFSWTQEQSHVLSMAEGRFLRVNAPGDCLNIRSGIGLDAPVLMCAADSVLLADRDDLWERDGMTWLAVRTPAGEPGWASADFLR